LAHATTSVISRRAGGRCAKPLHGWRHAALPGAQVRVSSSGVGWACQLYCRYLIGHWKKRRSRGGSRTDVDSATSIAATGQVLEEFAGRAWSRWLSEYKILVPEAIKPPACLGRAKVLPSSTITPRAYQARGANSRTLHAQLLFRLRGRRSRTRGASTRRLTPTREAQDVFGSDIGHFDARHARRSSARRIAGLHDGPEHPRATIFRDFVYRGRWNLGRDEIRNSSRAPRSRALHLNDRANHGAKCLQRHILATRYDRRSRVVSVPFLRRTQRTRYQTRTIPRETSESACHFAAGAMF